jgi:hypothetical protein
MKNYLYKLFVTLSSLLIVSCATQTKNDGGFYGYDNSPEREVQTEPKKPKKEWENPLADKSSYEEPEREQMVVNNYYYGNAGYVPVIAPWYGGYYGWGNAGRRNGVYVTFGAHRSYEWFSPWYDFHPYYGCTWYDYYYVHPHYRTWYNQPVYAYSPYYGRSWRYWGYERPRGRNDVTYNPRSSRVDYRRTDANYRSYRSDDRRSNSRSSQNSSRQNSSRSNDSYSSPTNSNGSYSGSSGNSRSGSSSNSRGSSGSYEQRNNNSRSSGNSRSNNSRGGSSRGGSSNRRGGGR